MAHKKLNIPIHVKELLREHKQQDGGGLTNQACSERFGIALERFNPIVNHGKTPTPEERAAFARGLGVHPDDILFGLPCIQSDGGTDATGSGTDANPVETMETAVARIQQISLDPKAVWAQHARFEAAVDILKSILHIPVASIVQQMDMRNTHDLGLSLVGKREPPVSGLRWLAGVIGVSGDLFHGRPLPDSADAVPLARPASSPDSSTMEQPSLFLPEECGTELGGMADVSSVGAESFPATKDADDAVPMPQVRNPSAPAAGRKLYSDDRSWEGIPLDEIMPSKTKRWPYGMRLGVALVRYCEAHGMPTTYESILSICGGGFTCSGLDSWVTGRFIPKPSRLRALADCIGLDVALVGLASEHGDAQTVRQEAVEVVPDADVALPVIPEVDVAEVTIGATPDPNGSDAVVPDASPAAPDVDDGKLEILGLSPHEVAMVISMASSAKGVPPDALTPSDLDDCVAAMVRAYLSQLSQRVRAREKALR